MDCCCTGGGPRSRPRRVAALAQWAAPIAALALVPKCPACLAGYVLLWTGVSLSVSTAAAVRGGMIAMSFGLLLFLALRAGRRAIGVRGDAFEGP